VASLTSRVQTVMPPCLRLHAVFVANKLGKSNKLVALKFQEQFYERISLGIAMNYRNDKKSSAKEGVERYDTIQTLIRPAIYNSGNGASGNNAEL
jgi:hypothetical protein